MGRAKGSSAATDPFTRVFGTRRSGSQPKLIDDMRLHREVKSGEEFWYLFKGGPLHRDHGPAYTRYAADGTAVIQEWRQHGEFHRDDGPARIEGADDHEYQSRFWYRHGKLHRDGEPAVISRFADGGCQELYYDHGDLHRLDGPAENYTAPDGESLKAWYYHGARHREDGPSRIEINANGSFVEEWYLHDRPDRKQPGPTRREFDADAPPRLTESYLNEHGQFHREDGPAMIVSTGNEGDDGFDSVQQYWFMHNVPCRPGEATGVLTERDGSRTETWHNEDEELHRSDGPAWVKIYPSGSRREEWFLHGELGRLDGGKPVVLFDADGGMTEEDTWHSD